MSFHLRFGFKNTKYNSPNPMMEPMTMCCVVEEWVLFSVHAFNLHVICFSVYMNFYGLYKS
jgi:hypothetical protein